MVGNKKNKDDTIQFFISNYKWWPSRRESGATATTRRRSRTLHPPVVTGACDVTEEERADAGSRVDRLYPVARFHRFRFFPVVKVSSSTETSKHSLLSSSSSARETSESSSKSLSMLVM